MAAPQAIQAGPLDGTEYLWVSQLRQKRVILITTLLAVLNGQAAALQATVAALTKQIGQDETAASALAQTVAGISAAATDLGKRVAALEAKPSVIWHASASIQIPTISALTSKTITTAVTGLVKGDLVVVQPASALPAGLAINYARAPADNTLEVAFDAVLAVSTASTVAFNVAALR